MSLMEAYAQILEKLGACEPGLAWVRSQPAQSNIVDLWLACERSDWMVWAGHKLKVKGWDKVAARAYAKPGLSHKERADLIKDGATVAAVTESSRKEEWWR